MTVIFQKSIIVLLALTISLPLHAEKLYPKGSRESEMPLCPQDEELIAQLETILDETVSKALDTQYMELNEKFRKESEKLSRSRSFWRKTAVTELFIIAGTFFSAGALYKLRN